MYVIIKTVFTMIITLFYKFIEIINELSLNLNLLLTKQFNLNLNLTSTKLLIFIFLLPVLLITCVKWLKWHNAYIPYKFNRIYWRIKNIYYKKFKYKNSKIKYNKFKRSQQECIWCKRIYVNKAQNGAKSYFCSSK